MSTAPGPRSGESGRSSPQLQPSPDDQNKAKRQIVGAYIVGKTIGEGTFGKVKLAVHIPTGEKVAIKILEKGRIKEPADVRRVDCEIKILKKARHGNVIQLFEVLDTRTHIFLIMEYAEGGEMFDFIVSQKRVEEVQACIFLHQIVNGLDALHSRHISHRDLKPENLLLKATEEGWLVKIVDFGLSNNEGGLLSTACGSPCYAAPEMIAGKKYHGPGADVWSVGVILFALVSGCLPFEDPNTSKLYKKILECDYECPAWLSPEVADLLSCILQVDPDRRYTIADIRQHPWYRIVSDEIVPVEDVAGGAAGASALAVMEEEHGQDPQSVLDAVASGAFNATTAMYNLLVQRYSAQQRERQRGAQSGAKHRGEAPSQERESDDDGEADGAGDVEGRKGVERAGSVWDIDSPSSESKRSYHNQPPRSRQQQQQHQHEQRQYKSALEEARIRVVPYLETPQLLLQAQAHAAQNRLHTQPQLTQPQQEQPEHQHQLQNGRMPSLDQYLRGGVELPTSVRYERSLAPLDIDQNDHNVRNVDHNVRTGNESVRNAKKAQRVPLLNLPRVKGTGAGKVVVSQTARGYSAISPPAIRAPAVVAPGRDWGAVVEKGEKGVAQTARAALGCVGGLEKRDSGAEKDHAGHDETEGMGGGRTPPASSPPPSLHATAAADAGDTDGGDLEYMGDIDALDPPYDEVMPTTRRTDPCMPARRPGGSGASGASRPGSSGKGGSAGEQSMEQSREQSRERGSIQPSRKVPGMVVMGNRKSSTHPKSQDSAVIDTPDALAGEIDGTSSAPSAPPSSAPSAPSASRISILGGRRGRYITGSAADPTPATAPAAAPTAPTVVAAPGTNATATVTTATATVTTTGTATTGLHILLLLPGARTESSSKPQESEQQAESPSQKAASVSTKSGKIPAPVNRQMLEIPQQPVPRGKNSPRGPKIRPLRKSITIEESINIAAS